MFLTGILFIVLGVLWEVILAFLYRKTHDLPYHDFMQKHTNYMQLDLAGALLCVVGGFVVLFSFIV